MYAYIRVTQSLYPNKVFLNEWIIIFLQLSFSNNTENDLGTVWFGFTLRLLKKTDCVVFYTAHDLTLCENNKCFPTL